MPNKMACFHLHIYQPPRGLPAIDYIDTELGAWPWQHWNERIFFDCYLQLAIAPVGQQLLNTYGFVSFNVGPTLLMWLRKE